MASDIQAREKVADLFERGCTWALEQVRQQTRPNLPLGFDDLIEGGEDLAKSDLRTTGSQYRCPVERLLGLEHSLAVGLRQHWPKRSGNVGREFAQVSTRSVIKLVDPELDDLHDNGRAAARRDSFVGFGAIEAAKALPDDRPYTLEQLLTKQRYPRKRHGLVDEPL